MLTFDVINLSSVMGEDGDYMVDTAHNTGKTVEFDQPPNKQDIINTLKDQGFLTEKANTNNITIHEWEIGTDSDSITLRDNDGMWLYELRPKAR